MKKAYLRKQSGLTMVEILVALTISMILLAGLGQIFVSNKQAYRTTEALSRLQENGRFAINFINRSIRDSDHWSCMANVNDIIDSGGAISANVDGIAGDETAVNFSAGLSSMNNVAVAGLLTSDTLRLISAAQDGMSVVNAARNTSTITLDSVSSFSDGDIILISDCANGQITTVNDVAGNVLTVDDVLLQAYSSDANVQKLLISSYSLGVNASGNPALYVDDGVNNQELVEGIEDMQVCIGGDNDGDQVADFYVPPGTAGLDMANAVSVKINLSVRTLQDNIAMRNRIYRFDDDCNSATALINGYNDRRIAKSYTSTIAIRNRLK